MSLINSDLIRLFRVYFVAYYELYALYLRTKVREIEGRIEAAGKLIQREKNAGEAQRSGFEFHRLPNIS